MNVNIEKYFIPDTSQRVELQNGRNRLFYLGEKGEGRTQMAIEQADIKPPPPMEKVFYLINEFLNQIVDNPIPVTKKGVIVLDEKKRMPSDMVFGLEIILYGVLNQISRHI